MFMNQLTFRLKTGQFLKEEIEQRAKTHGIKAGVLLSIVGALQVVKLRMAGSEPQKDILKEWHEDFEIVSGTGTISDEGCHIHVSLARQDGTVIGGHLKGGCAVRFTAEIVIGIFDDVVFKRTFDNSTGFKELIVESL